MATLAKPSIPSPVMERYHVYHAQAQVLSGHLEHPVKQPLENYGRVLLENTRRETLFNELVGATNVEGFISFKAGYTRVSGSQLKDKTDIWGNDHSGWVTQSTSVLEGFNVADVLTVDRIVAQISTEHPLVDGHVPRITFLGTRFENLQIAGHSVQVELNLGFCGNKPKGDLSYLEDTEFLDRVQGQFTDVAGTKGLPERLEKQYDAKIAYIDDLKKRAAGGTNGGRTGHSKLQCSLVKSIAPISIPGVRTFGNMIYIPDFGTISLAEIELGIGSGDHGFSAGSGEGFASDSTGGSYVTLHMLNMHLGCPLTATTQAGTASANGETKP